MARARAAKDAPTDAPTEGLSAQVTRAIPDIIVEVLPGNTVNSPAINTDKVGTTEPHQPGDKFQIEGPTAIALVQAGHVKIVGSVEP